MKVIFEYNREKDIWCILNYGKDSLNSSQQTKTYQELVNLYGQNPENKTGNDSIPKIAVTKKAQMVNGILHRLIPFVLRLSTVVT